MRNVPVRRVVNRLLDDIQVALPACRRSWWAIRRTTCLTNLWARMVVPERLEPLAGLMTGAKQIADASYGPDKQRLRIAFRDGTTADVSTRAMTSNRIMDAEFAAALQAGRTDAETEIRGQSVRYVADRDAVEIVTTSHAGFLIPRQWIGALQDVLIEDLAKLEIWPDGSAIALEDSDIHISVDGLLTAILPAMLPTRTVAAIFASRGGRATSDAKRSSAQENGRRGGRPRKSGKTVAA